MYTYYCRADSSVFDTLQEKVPVWGRSIKQLNALIIYTNVYGVIWKKMVEEKTQYKGKGKLTELNIIGLTTAI